MPHQLWVSHFMADGPDKDYCKIRGPLGMDTLPLRSAGVRPVTKEELKGDALPEHRLDAPIGRENYSSAEQQAEDIKKTFLEERDLGMALGPFSAVQMQLQDHRTLGGPPWRPSMKGQDQDHLRWLLWGANPHTQANREARTTAPMVMDRLPLLHWPQAIEGSDQHTRHHQSGWSRGEQCEE